MTIAEITNPFERAWITRMLLANADVGTLSRHLAHLLDTPERRHLVGALLIDLHQAVESLINLADETIKIDIANEAEKRRV